MTTITNEKMFESKLAVSKAFDMAKSDMFYFDVAGCMKYPYVNSEPLKSKISHSNDKVYTKVCVEGRKSTRFDVSKREGEK